MIPYFVVALILMGFSLVELLPGIIATKKKKISLFLVTTLLVFFSGLASSRGDSSAYLLIFNNPDEYYYIEIGYRLLNKLIKWMGGSILLVYICVSITCVSIKLKIYSFYSPYLFLSIFYLYTSTFISQEMGAVRFALASTGLLLSVYLVEKNRIKLLIVMLLVFSLFHFSVIVAFFLVFLNKIKFSKKNVFMLMSVFILLYFARIDIVEYIMNVGASLFPAYGAKAFNYMAIEPRAGLEFGILRRILLFLICAIIMPTKDFENSLVIKTYIVAIIAYFVFAPINIVAQRFSVLFSAVEPIVAAMIIARIKKEDRIVVFMVLAALQMFNLYRTLTLYSDAGNNWIPYTLGLWGDYQ